jgi:hypothetical protein
MKTLNLSRRYWRAVPTQLSAPIAPVNNERKMGGKVNIVQIHIRKFANSLKMDVFWGNGSAFLKNANYRTTMIGGGNAGV